MKSLWNNNKGFSIVEGVVAAVILGIGIIMYMKFSQYFTSEMQTKKSRINVSSIVRNLALATIDQVEMLPNFVNSTKKVVKLYCVDKNGKPAIEPSLQLIEGADVESYDYHCPSQSNQIILFWADNQTLQAIGHVKDENIDRHYSVSIKKSDLL